MAKSITRQIAQQMAMDLNAASAAVTLAPSFTAAAKFLPRGKLTALAADGRKIFIAGSDRQGARETRGARKYIHSIDLCLIAKITTEEGAEHRNPYLLV